VLRRKTKVTLSSIGLIGGLLLSLVTILSNVWINHLNKKKEMKKEIMLKILENSFKEYEFRTTHSIKEAEQQGRPAELFPYDYYLIHFAELAKLLDKEKFTEKEIKEVVEAQKLFIRVYRKNLEKSEYY
jgi:hypothetical protein